MSQASLTVGIFNIMVSHTSAGKGQGDDVTLLPHFGSDTYRGMCTVDTLLSKGNILTPNNLSMGF